MLHCVELNSSNHHSNKESEYKLLSNRTPLIIDQLHPESQHSPIWLSTVSARKESASNCNSGQQHEYETVITYCIALHCSALYSLLAKASKVMICPNFATDVISDQRNSDGPETLFDVRQPIHRSIHFTVKMFPWSYGGRKSTKCRCDFIFFVVVTQQHDCRFSDVKSGWPKVRAGSEISSEWWTFAERDKIESRSSHGLKKLRMSNIWELWNHEMSVRYTQWRGRRRKRGRKREQRIEEMAAFAIMSLIYIQEGECNFRLWRFRDEIASWFAFMQFVVIYIKWESFVTVHCNTFG
jgi:hypothetical protein